MREARQERPKGQPVKIDRNILLAIECATAASRWRIAARFEGPDTAAQFHALADKRSRAATRLLNRLGKAARSDDRAAPIATRTGRGAAKPESQSENL